MADEELELWIDPELRPGTWANWARVFEGPEEFVFDFACRDPDDGPEAVLVARVRCSPRVARKLADSLAEAWRRYARASLPKEVTDGETEMGSGPEDVQGQGPDEG